MDLRLSTPRVVVIIPTYNERGNIGLVTEALTRVFRGLKDYDPHILFVDDQSPDGTAQSIKQLSRRNPRIHLLTNKRKAGLGHAYKKGMIYALDKLGADVVFEFDADLSHDPAKIPAMLSQIESGADMVLGSRYVQGGGIPANWGFHRKFLSVVSNIFIRLIMCNFAIHDWTGGYRALTASLVRGILPTMNNSAFHGYTWQIGSLVQTIQKGYKVSEVPFHFRDRTLGRSKLGPEFIINALSYIMKTRVEAIVHSRIFKFVMVGGLGSLVQLLALHFYRLLILGGLGPLTPYQIALILAIETAIVSNFVWSNLWTFRDRKLQAAQIPAKFVQFNLASGGSLLIQFVLASLGERLIGLFTIFALTWPVKLTVDTGLIYAVVGILVGMFWNFFAYSRIVWRTK